MNEELQLEILNEMVDMIIDPFIKFNKRILGYCSSTDKIQGLVRLSSFSNRFLEVLPQTIDREDLHVDQWI